MNKGESSASGSKLERKTMEKNRRILMKNLCNELVFIIPDQHFNPAKEFLSQQDQIEQATEYIKILRERIEELKSKKTQLAPTTSGYGTNDAVNIGGSNSPILKIREFESSLEVTLISGIRKNFMLSQVISIIENEGGDVVTVNLSNIGDKTLHTIIAKAKVSRFGMDATRIAERIQELI